MKEPLTKEERVSYLANVLSIARADASIEQEEAVVLRDLADRLGVTEGEWLAAKRLLQRGRYGLRFLRRPSHRMANVQDMIMMALADGQASAAETKPIEKLAALMKFSQADMDMAVRRAEAELKRVMSRLGSAGKGGVPFDTPAEPPPPPPLPVPKPKEPPPPPPPPPPADEAPVEPLPAEPEPVSVKPAVEAPAARPESEPLPEPATQQEEDALTEVEDCIAQRDLSEHRENYCFGEGGNCINPWGCRLANMDWEPGADWLDLGAFRDDDTFVFDTEAIREMLEAALEKAHGCPHLRRDYVDAALAAFPKRASIWGRWVHRPTTAADPRGQAVSIREYLHGCGVSKRQLVNGVDPVGTREATKLIARAAKACGRAGVDVKRLRG